MMKMTNVDLVMKQIDELEKNFWPDIAQERYSVMKYERCEGLSQMLERVRSSDTNDGLYCLLSMIEPQLTGKRRARPMKFVDWRDPHIQTFRPYDRKGQKPEPARNSKGGRWTINI